MQNSFPKIAITQPNGGATSETFIRNDIKYLAAYAEIHNLSGAWLPMYANDKPILPVFIAKAEKILAQLLGKEFFQGFTAYRIAAYLKKNQIQVVVAKYGPGGVAMLPICKKLNIPLLVHFHGLDLTGDKILARYADGYRQLFREAAGILVVANSQTEVLLKMGCPREKIHFSIYGADVKWSAIKPHFTKKIFLGIGRFTAKKAPQNTIRAFAEVVKTFPDAQLQLVGNGELLLLCQTIIKELGLSQNVQLLGNQTPEQIEGLMRNAIAFVQHSITPPDNDTEGSPLAVIEAGMAGLPVISTLHGGIPDIVIEGKTGFLVAENDIQAMAEKMKLLAADLDFAKKMGDNAALHIATNISIPICIEREWRIIERFL